MNLVFFDIDGTLLVSKGAGGRSIIRVMKTVFQVEDEIARIEIQGQTDRGIASQLFKAHSIDDTEQNWSTFKNGYLEILDEELESSDGNLLPGIPSLLKELTDLNHVEMALLTGNVEQGALKKVRFFGIGEFFSWGGFGDEHRDRADLAKNALKVAKSQIELDEVENVFVIGDTPNDIRCGKAINAKTVAVATAGYSQQQLADHQPDHLLNDLGNIEEVLSILT